jgi:hypothetical protein
LLATSGSGAIPDSVLDDSTAAAAAAVPGGERGQGAAAAAAAAGSLWDVEGLSGGAVAVVVDAETTSFLMMGALSAGRHNPQTINLILNLQISTLPCDAALPARTGNS